MVKMQKPDLDEATLQIAKRILSTPPKPHKEMKLGKRKPKTGAKPSPGVPSGAGTSKRVSK
jgi:hypothetical protein